MQYTITHVRLNLSKVLEEANNTPIIITKGNKKYVLTAYDTARALHQLSKRVDALESLTAPLKEKQVNWGA